MRAGSDITEEPSEVFVDDSHKLNQDTFVENNQADLARIVKELDDVQDDYMSKASVWDRFLNVRFPITFRSSKMLVITLGIFASFAGALSGLDQSIISGATFGINETFDSSPDEDSLISSLMPLGAMAGSIMMTPLNHFFGRRMSIVISCLWYTLGGGICAGARSVAMLYAGRFFLGIGVGIEGGCVGIYISESVPPTVRGNLVSMYQMMLAFGEVMGYACGGIFFEVHGGWRFMLGSTLVFSTILMVGMFFLPESPRWLVSKGRIGRAWQVWKDLRDINEPANLLEFLEMQNTAEQEQREAENEKSYVRYFELVTVKRNRRALVYAVMMVFLGQMTGINAVLYNMGRLVKAMNFSDRDSVLMSLVGGGALFFGTIPAILWMDKFGRRVWAQNIVVFFVGLVLAGIGYLIDDNQRSAQLGVYFTGMILYMMFFGCYACLTWVLPAESFNLRTRAQGMSICSASLYLWSFIVTYNFDRMENKMTYTGLLIGFYGGISVVGFFYQLLFMPETKDKTLEEIDDIFNMHTMDLMAQNVKNLNKNWAWLCGSKRKPATTEVPPLHSAASEKAESDSFRSTV